MHRPAAERGSPRSGCRCSREHFVTGSHYVITYSFYYYFFCTMNPFELPCRAASVLFFALRMCGRAFGVGFCVILCYTCVILRVILWVLLLVSCDLASHFFKEVHLTVPETLNVVSGGLSLKLLYTGPLISTQPSLKVII